MDFRTFASEHASTISTATANVTVPEVMESIGRVTSSKTYGIGEAEPSYLRPNTGPARMPTR